MDEKTILVIEDDQLNMKLIKEILRLGGYTPLEALDAETGIMLARKHKPDLILMDMHLPGMDGIDATRIIVEDEELCEIPVVACTALAMPQDKEEAMQAGCIAYVVKPYRVKVLLDTVDDLLKPKKTSERK